MDFTTYECPVIVKKETGIDYSDTYSIKLKIKVSHVQTEDVHTIVTDIPAVLTFSVGHYNLIFFSFKEPFYLLYS